jgi:hypothetical protein
MLTAKCSRLHEQFIVPSSGSAQSQSSSGPGRVKLLPLKVLQQSLRVRRDLFDGRGMLLKRICHWQCDNRPKWSVRTRKSEIETTAFWQITRVPRYGIVTSRQDAHKVS